MQTIPAEAEVRASYTDVEDGLNKVFRQTFLRDNFGFSCGCPCCLMLGDRSTSIRA